MEIRFEDFTLTRGSKILLENLNYTLSFDKYNLQGPNGLGKSSLLDCIYRINDKYSGNIYIDNKNIKSISIKDLRSNYVSYINQNFMFFDYLTIENNVDLLVEDIEFQKAIINEMEQEFDVKANMLTSKLSGGQKQYFNILLNGINCNDILLIDEPYNNLSKNRIEKVRAYFNNLNKFIIIVSHKKSEYKPVLIKKRGLVCEE